MEFLLKKIKYQIENPLMFISRWILYSDRLYIESQLNNKKGVEIVFIMGIKEEADRLIKNRLNFRNIRKSVLYF